MMPPIVRGALALVLLSLWPAVQAEEAAPAAVSAAILPVP
jgi:hypothetical protein